jgi:dUTP pyrophosphatase
VAYIKQIAPDLPLPAYQTRGSAGMDLYANVNDHIIIPPGERALIPTGIAIQLPNDLEAQVRPRSGLALKQGITVLNTPGTVDADYRGEIGVLLINHEPGGFFVVNRGDRIAQLVISPVKRIDWVVVEELPASERGEGGFGSTGI